MPDEQRDFYNRLYASGSAAGASSPGQLWRRLELHRATAVSQLLTGGGHLLDVGSGDGSLLMACAPRFAALTGIELADVRLREAADRATVRGLRNVNYVQANVDRGIPLRDATVDAATIVAVLGFVLDPLGVLAELRRVIRPNGQLVLEVLNLAYLPRRMALLVGHLPRHSTADGWDGGHLHNFTRSALGEALGRYGFRVERWTGSGVAAPLRTWWPSLLTGNLIAACRRV